MSQVMAAAESRVREVSASVIRAVPESELALQLFNDLRIVPLQLNLSGQRMRRDDVELDVTGDPMRMGFPGGRRLIVPGVRVTIAIPYTGDSRLWKLQPSRSRMAAPRGFLYPDSGRLQGMLELVIEKPVDVPIEQFKVKLDHKMDDLQFFIDSQAQDLVGFDQRLQQAIVGALTSRRESLAKHDELADLLGIPEQSSPFGTPPAKVVSSAPAATRAGVMTQPQPDVDRPTWDVFVSHASEDKEDLVRPLVDALRTAGLRVWYDEAELRMGDSLRRSIDRGLRLSRFGVVVISPSFLAKQWPQRELDGLIAREDDGTKVVLPVWHDISAAEVRRASPTLADRLAVSSSRGVSEVAKEILRAIQPQ